MFRKVSSHDNSPDMEHNRHSHAGHLAASLQLRSGCRGWHQSADGARHAELAQEKPRHGYRSLTVLMRWEGAVVNHKPLFRIYRAAGLRKPTRYR